MMDTSMIFEKATDKSELKNAYARPFIKWAGGKTQLLKQFKDFYPSDLSNGNITRYCEPFLGGGAVFFDVVQNYKIKTANLFDINEELILVYKVVQADVYKLMEFLDRYSRSYKSLDDKLREEYFYELRQSYNINRFQIDFKHYSENWISRAAQMIFLNKTCFNGLYRLNSKGEFNVPFGNYKNPTILDQDNLLNASKVLSIAELRVESFEGVLKSIDSNSFIYFDPPYRPINKTSSFTSYSTFEFRDEQQKQLANTFSKADSRGAKLMLSNSDPKNYNNEDDFFDELYSNYNITRVLATRMVNSNGQKRGAIKELLIRNYN